MYFFIGRELVWTLWLTLFNLMFTFKYNCWHKSLLLQKNHVLTFEAKAQELWLNVFMILKEGLARIRANMTQCSIRHAGSENNGFLVSVRRQLLNL